MPLWFVLVPLFAAPVDLDAVVAQAGNVTIEVPVFEGGVGLDFCGECAARDQRPRPNVTVNPTVTHVLRTGSIRCLRAPSRRPATPRSTIGP